MAAGSSFIVIDHMVVVDTTIVIDHMVVVVTTIVIDHMIVVVTTIVQTFIDATSLSGH